MMALRQATSGEATSTSLSPTQNQVGQRSPGIPADHMESPKDAILAMLEPLKTLDTLMSFRILLTYGDLTPATFDTPRIPACNMESPKNVMLAMLAMLDTLDTPMSSWILLPQEELTPATFDTPRIPACNMESPEDVMLAMLESFGILFPHSVPTYQ